MSTTGKYKLSNRAITDLKDIWRYTLENWSRKQADRYISGLLEDFDKISLAPRQTGQSCDYIRNGYWKRPCGRHIIFYRILEDGSVLISRILHERMDYKRHL